MALILPIMLALICMFIGLMLEVELSIRVTAALRLATSSGLTAAFNSGSKSNGSCQFAQETFNATIFQTTAITYNGSCSEGVVSDPVNASDPVSIRSFSCTGTYLAGGAPGAQTSIKCTGSVSLNYDKTALSLLFFNYRPVFTDTLTVYSTGFQQ